MSTTRTRSDSTPDLGELADLDLVAVHRPAGAEAVVSTRRPGRGAWPIAAVLAVALLAVLAALVVWREDLGQRLVPTSPLSQQLESAQEALARGDLSRVDGQGARELFQAVLAVDPDHVGARAGLAAVRDAALVQAAQALDRGDRAAARKAVALATELSAPASALIPLEARMRAAQSTAQDLEALLSMAQAQARAGDDVGALAAFEKVLADQPANTLALEGRRALLAAWLRQASERLALGDVDSARNLVQRVVERDPSHLDLPAAQARLGEALAQRERLQERELELADQDLRGGRIEAAARRYQALLATAPDLAEARAGLERAAAAQAARATRLGADFKFDQAEQALGLASAWAPASATVASAGQRLRQARAAHGQIDAGADAGRLPDLLAAADAALRRGDLLEPPGDSAWDKLRAAAAIAPRDPAVVRLLASFDNHARDCFEAELLGNRLSAAEACLDARALRASAASLGAERRRLALRWIALASERIGENEPETARRALASARRLDPAAPGLAETEQRLAQVMEAQP